MKLSQKRKPRLTFYREHLEANARTVDSTQAGGIVVREQ